MILPCSIDFDLSFLLLLLSLRESLLLSPSLTSSLHVTLNALKISSFYVRVPVLSQKMKSI